MKNLENHEKSSMHGYIMEKSWNFVKKNDETTSSQKISCQTHTMLIISKFIHGLQACLFKFMLNVVKMPQKGEVGGHALNSHGNYIVDHGKSGEIKELCFLISV